MCSIERKYDDKSKIEISLKYESDGKDSWMKKRKDAKQYILFFSFFREEVTRDGKVERFMQPEDKNNIHIVVEYPGRYSQKRFDKLCSRLHKYKDELLDLYTKAINGEDVFVGDILNYFRKKDKKWELEQ